MPRVVTSGEKPVAEVDDFLGFELEIFHCLDHRLPDSEIALMAAMHPKQIGGNEATNGASGPRSAACLFVGVLALRRRRRSGRGRA